MLEPAQPAYVYEEAADKAAKVSGVRKESGVFHVQGGAKLCAFKA